jgi:transposase
MRPPISVRAVTDDERQVLEDGLRSPDAFVLRRCQMLLASERGERVPQIARTVGCSDQTVRNVLHAFNARGLVALTRQPSRPHTIHAVFDAAGDERLRELLHQSPRAFGKPTSVWTLPLAAEVCADAGITAKRVSGETIRKTLKRLGIRWQRAKQWIASPDPAYAEKNASGIV